ncbi:MAG: HAD-IIB family hydrolase [Opitutales bacterium]|nr:HAD-IIB family hydrolase [Opitutales bacterium]
MPDCKPKKPLNRPCLLASDLDGTLIPLKGNDSAKKALQQLDALLEAGSIPLVYVTGRHFDSVCQVMKAESLPRPEWIISDVGSSAYEWSGSGYRLSEAYRDCLGAMTGNVPASKLVPYFESIPGLRLQEDAKQGAFKLSYYTDAEESETLGSVIASRLRTEDLPYHCVVSVDPFNGDGLIDLLPLGVSKAFALEWLARKLGLNKEAVVFAGDSGNDYAALVAGFRAVLVGNASADVREKVSAAHREAGLENCLYCANGQSTSGVLEGARHYGLL